MVDLAQIPPVSSATTRGAGGDVPSEQGTSLHDDAQQRPIPPQQQPPQRSVNSVDRDAIRERVLAIRAERERQQIQTSATAGGGESGASGGEVEVGGAPSSTISDSGRDTRDLNGQFNGQFNGPFNLDRHTNGALGASAVSTAGAAATSAQTARGQAAASDMMLMASVRARVLGVREAREREEAEHGRVLKRDEGYSLIDTTLYNR